MNHATSATHSAPLVASRYAGKVLLSHPTGNSHVRQAVISFSEAGVLGEFHTTIASYPGSLWDLLGRLKAFGEFNRRQYPEVARRITKQHPAREICRAIAQKLGGRSLIADGGPFNFKEVYLDLDRAVAERIRKRPEKFDTLYVVPNGGSVLHSLKSARRHGIHTVYEIVYPCWEFAQDLIRTEMDRLPTWAPTLARMIECAEVADRKRAELELSDTLVCPSAFVRASIPQQYALAKRMVMAPFGSPGGAGTRVQVRQQTRGKLRVLFAGSMGQRKGLGDLFAAMRLLNRGDVELIVMGSCEAPMDFYRREYSGFTYEPGRSHDSVLALMRTCDVFCLPSIIEGRALVLQEAMSQGLPLIITPNTGGEDLVREGETGFIVRIRRPDLIAEKIAWFADNRDRLPEMSIAAQAQAGLLTWKGYGEAIVGAALKR